MEEDITSPVFAHPLRDGCTILARRGVSTVHLKLEGLMAWFNDYDRGYAGFGYRGYGYGTPYYGGWTGWGAVPYGGGYWGGMYGNGYNYGYDEGYTYRRSPERSPTYGRGGDEAARRYARSHGYDTGYTIRPDNTRRLGTRPRRYTGDYDRGYRGTDYIGYGGYDRGYRW
jgi:hypothetical protein